MTADECRVEGQALYDTANHYGFTNLDPKEIHLAINAAKALWEIAAQLAWMNTRNAIHDRYVSMIMSWQEALLKINCAQIDSVHLRDALSNEMKAVINDLTHNG